MRTKVLGCLFVLSMVASMSLASDGRLHWAYQATGFVAGSSSAGPQTALAMGDGRTWPVIFSPNTSGMVQAYSLYPVRNPQTQTNWFQIGTNLLPGDGVLSAASSSDGRVAAVTRSIYSPANGAAVVGSRSTGFAGPMPGVLAVDFDSHGNLVQGTMNTIPLMPSLPQGPLVDIAVSPTGEIGAVDMNSNYYQQSPLLGWQGISLPRLGPSPDLAMDSAGRPHIAGLVGTDLVAYDFDVIHGQWAQQMLASASSPGPISLATLAADSQGGVGAAWVQGNTLMYGYKDGIENWRTQAVTTGVYGTLVDPFQMKVGLAFDANDYPVISFIAGGNIWLAYDPIVVPEPCALMLLASGTVLLAMAGWKSTWRRLRR